MKPTLTIILAFCISILFTKAQVWEINPKQSSVTFTSDHATGSFRTITGTIHFDPKVPEKGSVALTIPVSSISFENETQTNHALSPKWLDESKFGSIEFKSTSIKTNGENFVAIGKITIYGVENEVSIPFSYEQTKKSGIFTGQTLIKRSDYQFGGNSEKVTEITVTVKIAVTK